MTRLQQQLQLMFYGTLAPCSHFKKDRQYPSKPRMTVAPCSHFKKDRQHPSKPRMTVAPCSHGMTDYEAAASCLNHTVHYSDTPCFLYQKAGLLHCEALL